ncbi:MAG TPA: ABC transporter ATP-binding protein [Thermoanaerobaculia bacterium]|nr:ABC transporter ATP-binding protein [Thermoanaerobaculia bacterium]
MSELAIRAVDLHKAYSITRAETLSSYRTLREDLHSILRGALRRGSGATREIVKALDGVSFDVSEGEVVGIIGRNGAGKSTLLKLLSRVTDPTAGHAEVYGRVGALLEVGTGFHPELTGHENIYLSATILGLRRAEITRKLAEIVEFAEIGPFLETPVKRYSSGMYMRLAFSVAAHLDPEILVVDEVLAVGDAEFQRKCLGKMNAVSQRGRTVLFVSHNMAAIQQLCGRVIVLDKGRVGFDGPTEEGVLHYMGISAAVAETDLAGRRDRRGTQRLRFRRVELLDAGGEPVTVALSGRDLVIRLHYEADAALDHADVNVAFNVRSPNGTLIANLNTTDSGGLRQPVYRSGYFECRWPRFNLRAGAYDCALYCAINGEVVDWLQNAFRIDVDDGDFYGTGRLVTRDQGDVLIDYSWTSGDRSS